MKTFGDLKTGDDVYVIYKSWFDNKYKVSREFARLRHYKFNTRLYNWNATVPNNVSVLRVTSTHFYCADINAIFNCVNNYELE